MVGRQNIEDGQFQYKYCGRKLTKRPELVPRLQRGYHGVVVVNVPTFYQLGGGLRVLYKV